MLLAQFYFLILSCEKACQCSQWDPSRVGVKVLRLSKVDHIVWLVLLLELNCGLCVTAVDQGTLLWEMNSRTDLVVRQSWVTSSFCLE